MLSIKETKNGGVAYVFGKEFKEMALKAYPSIAAKVLGVIEGPVNEVNGKTLADIKQAVEEKKSNGPKLRINVPKTTSLIPNNPEEIRKDIHALISEICSRDGLQRGLAWNKAYRMLAESTGFDVYYEKPVYSKGKTSLIQSVIEANKGADMCRILRRYLDK